MKANAERGIVAPVLLGLEDECGVGDRGRTRRCGSVVLGRAGLESECGVVVPVQLERLDFKDHVMLCFPGVGPQELLAQGHYV